MDAEIAHAFLGKILRLTNRQTQPCIYFTVSPQDAYYWLLFHACLTVIKTDLCSITHPLCWKWAMRQVHLLERKSKLFIYKPQWNQMDIWISQHRPKPKIMQQSQASSHGELERKTKQIWSDMVRKECCHFTRNAINQTFCADETERNENWQSFELHNTYISGSVIRDHVWSTEEIQTSQGKSSSNAIAWALKLS